MRRASWKKRISSLGMFLIVSALAGLLVSGLAIPVAALAGVAGSTINDSLTLLPDDLVAPPVAERTTLLMADGSFLADYYDEFRVIVTLDQIAPVMQQAQVAIEDDRFFQHGALDLRSLVKAVVSNFGSSDGGGGSTLTQQLVKQMLVEKASKIPNEAERAAALDEAQGRTIARKFREMRYAIALEKKYSKDEILERYLNIAYYGDGAYGVEAAAEHYFGTTAAQLTLPQAAMLAGLVQSPSINPGDSDTRQASIDRRNVVIGRMLELGLISQADADAAIATPFDPNSMQYSRNGCENITNTDYVQVCRYVFATLKTDAFPGLGSTPEERDDALRTGGYTITTTLDPTTQHATQMAISNRIADNDPVKSAMVIMQPGTGKVLAAAQNRREYGSDMKNNGESSWIYFAPPSPDPDNIAGGDEGAQPGSTFKAFVVAAALDAGVPPSKQFNAQPSMDFSNVSFRTCDGDVKVPWPVSNDGGEGGVMDMWHATANSVNTYFAQLEHLVGICAPVTMAVNAGVQSTPDLANDRPDLMSYNVDPSFTLGTPSVSPISMATAYSTFAARGVRCDPVVVTEIKASDGTEMPDIPNGNCTQVMRPEVADGVNALLGNAFTYGTASGFGLSGRSMSGKTGTTEEGNAAWLIGYAPNIVGVSMVAVDNNPDWNSFWDQHMRGVNHNIKSMYNVTLPVSGTYVSGYGAATAGPIWKAAMSVAVQNLEVQSFTKPTSEILNGARAVPPSTAGMTQQQATKVLEDADFFVQVKQVYDDSAPGTLVGVSCDYIKGGTCTLNISQGPRPPEPSQTPEPISPPSGGPSATPGPGTSTTGAAGGGGAGGGGTNGTGPR